ncbi:MAG: hypothetical protein JWQ09_5249 [Segetibacter sp.]|nr:hypothetical protein [Segetibacter sp.]
MLALLACKKDETPAEEPFTCSTCSTTPRAVAANDATSKGVYKGIVIGSSGTIMFDINNTATTITAAMVIDGITVNLTSNVSWVAGQAYVAPFTGTLNGSPVSITFSVASNGGSPTVTTSSIPGHANASFNIIKETSTGLLECWEGTYSTTKPETGTFNLLLIRSLSKWTADARKTGSTTTNSSGNGTITNGKLIDPSQNNRTIRTLNGDKLDGNFVDNNGITITITGKRTF